MNCTKGVSWKRKKGMALGFNPFDDSELIDNAKVVIPVHYLEVKQDPALMV